MKNYLLFSMIICGAVIGCTSSDSAENPKTVTEWQRFPDNPIFRDVYPDESYQSASDPHVVEEGGQRFMFYSGDVDGYSGIKLAKGNSWSDWEKYAAVSVLGSDENDRNKETAFYHRTDSGKHQLYYIGYEKEDLAGGYKADIFLAEADRFEGPYERLEEPVVPAGLQAGKEVYCFTSPNIVPYGGKLYLSCIAWNNHPEKADMIWIMGAVSEDDGHTWTDLEEVDSPIGMEGQVTVTPDGNYVGVRTGDYKDKEAIFYATALHPFGPWDYQEEPILIRAGQPYEVTELIAPQITFDMETAEPYLYYTGADQQVGWWVMLATRE